MSYRDPRPDPPLCECGEPAVVFVALHGVFMCRRGHMFDADFERFCGCKLAGAQALDPEPETRKLTGLARLAAWLRRIA